MKPGSVVTIGGRPFTVVGVAEQRDSSQAAAGNLYVPLSDAQRLAGVSAGQVNQVYVRLRDAGRVDTVVERLGHEVGQVNAVTEDSLLQVMGGIGRVSARFADIAAVVGVLGGLVLTWVSLAGLIAERTQEIGLMKALGWRARDVARAFLLEALLLTLAGGVAGIAAGMAAAWALGRLPLVPPGGAPSTVLPGSPRGRRPRSPRRCRSPWARVPQGWRSWSPWAEGSSRGGSRRDGPPRSSPRTRSGGGRGW